MLPSLSFQHNFPRTLEALILHLLSPVGAEVLTRKFDEMDQKITEENRYFSTLWTSYSLKRRRNLSIFALSFIIYDFRNKFYEFFYGAFDDQFAAMDAILNGKESFALKVILTS